MFNQITLLCRSGFEKECAAEIIELANKHNFPAYIKTQDKTAYVFLMASTNESTAELIKRIQFKPLIFTRQWFACNNVTFTLPEKNRIPDILNGVQAIRHTLNETATDNQSVGFYDIEMDYPDTNEGKSISKFCTQFQPHIQAALKKNKLLNNHSPWRLHLYFTNSQQLTIGISPINNTSNTAMGIARLKMPHDAPSRSTLKLDEAIQWFLSDKQQQTLFQPGMKAADLGAAPGGWTWQLVQRGCLVTAIDNGPIQEKLMETAMVEHLQTDAFTFTPKKTVDWLVCDMAERPLHVSRLIARWFTDNHCNNAIFNLKLPMKKRLLAVQECLELIGQQLNQAGINHQIQAKQLYHDREEITVCILRKNHLHDN